MPKFLLALLLAALTLSAPFAAHAREAAPASDNPALEQRVLALSQELRCLVCQNQTIAESHAPLAIDLRNQVREKLKAGASEADVVQFMVDRYGDFVLYRPPFKARTLLLWAGPFVLLLGALAFLFIQLRRRRQLTEEAPVLDAASRERAQALIDAGKDPK